jgi:hypothetical protein
MAAAGSIRFVRHDGEIRMAGTVPSYAIPAHLCNTLASG